VSRQREGAKPWRWTEKWGGWGPKQVVDPLRSPMEMKNKPSMHSDYIVFVDESGTPLCFCGAMEVPRRRQAVEGATAGSRGDVIQAYTA
jgi:hypothetical protein